MLKFPTKYALWLLRLAIGFILIYFGTQALLNPELQAAHWVSHSAGILIEAIMPLKVFMIILGLAQVISGGLVALGLWLRYALPVVALLLVGIIINVGWNEVAYRDFVILTSVIYLYSQEQNKPQATE